jgi:hypothetical protein
VSPAVTLGEDGSATLDFGAAKAGKKFGVGVSLDKDRLVTEVRSATGIYDFKFDQYGSAPGLWELRPREEFGWLGWASLDTDEQRCLALLGFDQRRWDYKLVREGPDRRIHHRSGLRGRGSGAGGERHRYGECRCA